MNSYIEITPDTTPAYVDPFPGRDGDELEFDPCKRCGGEGRLPGYEHVDNAICYGCFDKKGVMVQVRVLRARESGRLSGLRSAHKKWAASAARHNANLAKALELDEIAGTWHEEMATDSFLLDLWTKAFDYDLSEKQVAALVASLRRRADRAAAKTAEAEASAPVPEGRYEVEGEILSTKTQEGDWGTVVKMLVQHETGYKVWVSVPEALWGQLEAEVGDDVNVYALPLKGRRVRFTATVEASRDDKSFGFGKRPAKALLLPA